MVYDSLTTYLQISRTNFLNSLYGGPRCITNNLVDRSKKKKTSQNTQIVCYSVYHFPVYMLLTSVVPLDTGYYEETCHNMF